MNHHRISASDISEKAAEVFLLNQKLLEKPLPFILSPLMQEIPGKFDMIISNPPYLTETEVDKMQAANWPEPELALRAGADGLDIIRDLAGQCMESLNDRGYLLIEAGFNQMESIKSIFADCGFTSIKIKKDLAGLDRVIIARK